MEARGDPAVSVASVVASTVVAVVEAVVEAEVSAGVLAPQAQRSVRAHSEAISLIVFFIVSPLISARNKHPGHACG